MWPRVPRGVPRPALPRAARFSRRESLRSLVTEFPAYDIDKDAQGLSPGEPFVVTLYDGPRAEAVLVLGSMSFTASL